MKTTWRYPAYDAINERAREPVPAPAQAHSPAPLAQPSIGITMVNSTVLELLDDGNLQVRIRGTEQAINLGRGAHAMQALVYALDMLSIHFEPALDKAA
jgi:hypothetical protein